ncbi:unnamed protein product [Owenia fusiformis]|uniref:Uncharacterized protein n=1 Tax=Owenia fusiformis TaxID=6347 RepID=A0A8J1UNC2_OWEFU|nr:unnamed protein product [Owenia fusiformis]
MQGLILLCVLIAGVVAQNQIEPFFKEFPCPFEADTENTDCCHYRMKNSRSGKFHGACMGGSVWSADMCACARARNVADCDPTTCDVPPHVAPTDCTEDDNSDTQCCRKGLLYTVDEADSTAYVMKSGRLVCHPGMEFSIEFCGCIGEAIMEPAVTEDSDGN